MQYIDGLGLDVVIDELRRLHHAGWNPNQPDGLALTEGLNRCMTEPASDWCRLAPGDGRRRRRVAHQRGSRGGR